MGGARAGLREAQRRLPHHILFGVAADGRNGLPAAAGAGAHGRRGPDPADRLCQSRGVELVRLLRRTPEVATRLALGASRWEIQKQFWSENLLLAIIGGALGIVVGFSALRVCLLLLPPHFLPVQHVSIDAHVLLFTLAVSLFTSVLFGMLPAFAVRNVDLRSSMGGRSGAVTGTAACAKR